MKKNYTITIFAHNEPGVLYRIADLFLRRKINIESLTVSEIETEGISRFTIVVLAEFELVEKLVKQLYRIIEITKVIDNVDEDLIIKEIALFKVHARNLENRKEIEQLSKLSKAKIIKVKKDYLVIEIYGAERQTDDFYKLMKPFGIKEFVRSGRIALIDN